jgi:hypothetical protein
MVELVPPCSCFDNVPVYSNTALIELGQYWTNFFRELLGEDDATM